MIRDLFKSFFRTIGRILAYLFIGAVISLLFTKFKLMEVKADTFTGIAIPKVQFYDNYGPTLSPITTEYSNESWRATLPGMVANSSGAAIGFTSPMPLLANHTYTVSVKIEGTYGGNIVLSTYNRVGVGTSLNEAVSSYQNNTNATENYSKVLNDGMTIQFAFTPKVNSSYFIIPFATSYTGNNQSFYIYNISINDLGSSGVSQDDINNSLTNQTNDINNSINTGKDEIKDSITDTENNIKDKIDDMEDSINDNIKDNLNSCRPSVNLFNPDLVNINSYIIRNNVNSFTLNGVWAITFINNKSLLNLLKPNTTYTISYKFKVLSKNTDITQYNTPLALYRFEPYYFLKLGKFSTNQNIDNIVNVSQTFTTPNDLTDISLISYSALPRGSMNIEISDIMLVEGSTATKFEEYGKEVCSNKLDEANETNKGIWATIKDLPNQFLNMLKGLIIPDNFDFINDFKDTLSKKLGFIASVPIQLLDFMIGLGDVAFQEITSISFPSISIFGYNFWNAQEIDITEGLKIIKPFKYFTDFMCVILCCNTLRKFYHNFTGGDVN